MHPLKKDEYKLLNRMKFEAKNVLEHLNRVAENSKKINQQEVERRLLEIGIHSRELAQVQRAIDLEIQKNR
jgi:HD superfamily phosphodiesterase